jgi:hypothetical protein
MLLRTSPLGRKYRNANKLLIEFYSNCWPLEIIYGVLLFLLIYSITLQESVTWLVLLEKRTK